MIEPFLNIKNAAINTIVQESDPPKVGQATTMFHLKLVL